MPQREMGSIAVPFLMLAGLCVFLTGLGWGLPSSAADSYLFGEKPVWTGEQILALAGDRSGERVGADVDRDPNLPGEVLNDTDARRAQIVRRYRLYTDQPDEMITMMALAGMSPATGDFDPKLYQYGGLWVYPVAGFIKLTTTLKSQSHYLDHPEEFRWFYVAARLYSAAWGLLGIWAVYWLVQRSGAGWISAVGAGLLFLAMPVVVNQAHEAKPHLAGAVLVLLAVMAGGRFVETGLARWWMLAAGLCGASMGMILSAGVVFIILPVMVLMRPMPAARRAGMLAGAMGLGLLVYFVTNPYVFLHLIGDTQILRSNLGNSVAMYPVGTRLVEGFVNAVYLLSHGTTPLVAIAGVLGVVVLARRWRWLCGEGAAIGLLLLVSAVVMIQFILLAAGKPAEYARFSLVPGIGLMLAAVIWVGRAKLRTFERIEVMGLLLVLTAVSSIFYLRGYSRDAGPDPRRMGYARTLDNLQAHGARTLGVFNEPAPYLLPPVNLFDWSIRLLPDDFDFLSTISSLEVIVRPVDELRAGVRRQGGWVLVSERDFDDLFPSRISWAAKPIEIWVRTDLLEGPASRPSE